MSVFAANICTRCAVVLMFKMDRGLRGSCFSSRAEDLPSDSLVGAESLMNLMIWLGGGFEIIVIMCLLIDRQLCFLSLFCT